MQDSNVHVHVSRIPLKTGYSLVTAYVVNKRSNPSSEVEGLMFQVGIKAHAEAGSAVFIAEHICRNVLSTDEFYFEQRPIMGRGRGCAAVWGKTENGRTDYPTLPLVFKRTVLKVCFLARKLAERPCFFCGFMV